MYKEIMLTIGLAIFPALLVGLFAFDTGYQQGKNYGLKMGRNDASLDILQDIRLDAGTRLQCNAVLTNQDPKLYQGWEK